jgi:hypothetical protein
VGSVINGLPFVGHATTKGPVVYLTEQSDSTFKVALQRAGLLHRNDLIVVTWAEASKFPWAEVVRLAVQKCKQIGAILLVVDTIGQFTGLIGDAENNAGDALKAMQPLQQAASEGLGVLVSQHERKSGGDVEDSGRGSSAFAGAADIVLSIRRLPGYSSPKLRTIRAMARFDETPAELTVELTADGYVVQDTDALAARNAEASILAVIPESEDDAMTVEALCEGAGMKRTVAQAAIKALVREGIISQIGKGHKGDPFRYCAIHSAGTSSPKAAERI